MSVAGSASPRLQRSRNKIYRTPPTPEPGILYDKEKSFVIDSMATSSISSDYSKANPKLGPVIPPYNSQRDPSVSPYFSYTGVHQTLKKTGQNCKRIIKEKDRNGKETERVWYTGTSIEGPVMDKFNECGAGYMYLSLRNQSGAGHSTESIDGHGQFMQSIKPVFGYNGFYGYRRNNPWLRMSPSPFGTASRSPTQGPSVLKKKNETQS